MFNEYQHKDLSSRIQIRFVRNVDLTPRPWEISHFISKYSSYYYKIELLNTISFALSEGVSPHDIIILDESFKLSHSHAKLDVIDLTQNIVKHLYSIGKPISLLPNKEIFILNLLFKLFRNFNEQLFRSKNKRINRKHVSRYYKKIIETDVKKGFRILADEVKMRLEGPSEKVKINIDKVLHDAYQKYETYEKDSLTFPEVTELLLSENYDLKKVKKEYGHIYLKYYEKFFGYFNKLSRPVIGIYYRDEHKVQILCKEHIARVQSSYREAKLLDIKEISHNSPLGAIIEGGVAVYQTIKDEKRKDELHELQMRKLELEIEEQLTRNQTAELEKINIMINNLKNLDELEGNPEVQAVKNVASKYLAKQIESTYSKMAQNTDHLLTSNQYTVDYNKTKVIDYLV